MYRNSFHFFQFVCRYLTRAAQIEKTRNDPTFIPGINVDDQRKLKDTFEREATTVATYSTSQIVGLTSVSTSASNSSSNANAGGKKKQGDKKQKQKKDSQIEQLSNALRSTKVSDKPECSFEIPSVMRSDDQKQSESAKDDAERKPEEPEEDSESAERRLRALRKKRKEIMQLEERVRNGTLPNPNSEQLAKLERLKTIDVEIQQLENSLRS